MWMMGQDWRLTIECVEVCRLRVKKDVTEILKEGGVDLNKVKAFILSHW